MSLLIDKFYDLPKENVNIILEYAGIIVWRNGKYMKRLLKTDERFKLYDTVPKYKINFIPNKKIITQYFCFYKGFNDDNYKDQSTTAYGFWCSSTYLMNSKNMYTYIDISTPVGIKRRIETIINYETRDVKETIHTRSKVN
jgi:hypothetical protein